MNIDELTIGEAKQLIKIFSNGHIDNYQSPNIGKYVVVRTYAAGVHFGILASYDAHTRHAVLAEARRLWSWSGAFTLSAVAKSGVSGGKLSAELPTIEVARVEEIIPCSSEAERVLRQFEEHKP